MNMKKISSLQVLLANVVIWSVPVVVGAQLNSGGGGSPTIKNPIKASNFAEFLRDILEIVVQIGVPVVVLGIIYSGFLFVTAQGNDSKLTEAKKTFVYTLIGAGIVLGAFVIATAIQGTVNQLK